MDIEKTVFISGRLENVDIFRLPYRGSQIYFSQIFVDQAKEHGFEGVDFIPVR